jgi:SPP1 family predicted phage head-tail adaptor
LKAGKLRHLVTIQTPTTNSDEYGTQITTWSAHGTAWGEFKSPGGKEELARLAGQETVTQVAEWTIRYLAGITPGMRVSFDSRVWDIHTVRNEGERDRMMILTCTEIA